MSRTSEDLNIRKVYRRKPMSEINVVPYIDVMLVLLVIFMVTALMTQGIKVELPQATSEPITIRDEFETLLVAISRDDQYTNTVKKVSNHVK